MRLSRPASRETVSLIFHRALARPSLASGSKDRDGCAGGVCRLPEGTARRARGYGRRRDEGRPGGDGDGCGPRGDGVDAQVAAIGGCGSAARSDFRFPGMSQAGHLLRSGQQAVIRFSGRGIRASGARTSPWTRSCPHGAIRKLRRGGHGRQPHGRAAGRPRRASGWWHVPRCPARRTTPGAQGSTAGRRHVQRRHSQAAYDKMAGASAITSTWSWDRCANARHSATSASQSNVPWSTPVASSMTV